jgi:AcrR family transcriptional regulator
MHPDDAAQRGNLQSKKHDLVRHEIWMAAIDLFYADGFDAVTVEQIAARAGVSRRTFFRYFSSKDDLMGSTLKAYGELLGNAIRADETDVGAYEVAKRAVASVLMSQPSTATTERFMEIGKRSVAARSAQSLQLPIVEEQLARTFAARAGRTDGPSIEDRILASLTFATTKFCVDIWVEQPMRPVEEIVEDVFARLSAICRPIASNTRYAL